MLALALVALLPALVLGTIGHGHDAPSSPPGFITHIPAPPTPPPKPPPSSPPGSDTHIPAPPAAPPSAPSPEVPPPQFPPGTTMPFPPPHVPPSPSPPIAPPSPPGGPPPPPRPSPPPPPPPRPLPPRCSAVCTLGHNGAQAPFGSSSHCVKYETTTKVVCTPLRSSGCGDETRCIDDATYENLLDEDRPPAVNDLCIDRLKNNKCRVKAMKNKCHKKRMRKKCGGSCAACER